MSHRTIFHFEGKHHRLVHGDLAHELMQQTKNEKNRGTEPELHNSNEDEEAAATTTTTFSDWSFYHELKQQPGCTHVELSQIHVDHSSWFLTGLQAEYRSHFADHRLTIETAAPQHDFQRFRYQQYGQSARSSLKLLKDEYITNLSFRRVDKISDRITIITNLREVSFGSPDFSCFTSNFLLPFSPATTTGKHQNHHLPQKRRVVALGGISWEMSEQLGCFSESLNWTTLKDWILVRKLVEQNRAEPTVMTMTVGTAGTTETEKKEGQIITALVTETNDDIFKRVLGFLVDAQ